MTDAAPTPDRPDPAAEAPSLEHVPIEDYVCLALYTASRTVTGLYRELLREVDLTYTQYLVMRLLWQRGPVAVKDIAAVLVLDYGTLSPLLKRLEARGLITRVRRADDERSVEIHLTDAGREMRAGASRVPDELVCALGMDDKAIGELRAQLRTLTATVNASGA